MFENLDEKQARQAIREIIAQYYGTFHKNLLGEKNTIPYAGRVYDEEEMCALVDSSLDFWLTAGRYAAKFEKEFAEFLGTKFCSAVNSGSSANLLAFAALTSPLLEERAVKPGDEVITVAAGFPTTVSPIIQYGAVPVFVDVTIPQYNINTELLEKALSPKTKAVILAHTLGNPFNIKEVRKFCNSNDLWLVEDNCDALGSLYKLDGEEKFTGTFGDIGTSSFYPPHHMTMGEGGAVYTDNPLLRKIILSMRDWGRDCICPPGKDNICGKRFKGKHGELPEGYDHKYVYSHFGYNLKITDMQAAIGCAQLKKLSAFIDKRRENFDYFKNKLKELEDFIILPEAQADSKPSWFGFPITLHKSEDRDGLVRSLETAGIQTRMLFAGNIIKHPCFDTMRKEQKGFRTVGELKQTDRIMSSTFWTGVYPGMTREMLDKIAETIKNYFGTGN